MSLVHRPTGLWSKYCFCYFFSNTVSEKFVCSFFSQIFKPFIGPFIKLRSPFKALVIGWPHQTEQNCSTKWNLSNNTVGKIFWRFLDNKQQFKIFIFPLQDNKSPHIQFNKWFEGKKKLVLSCLSNRFFFPLLNSLRE